MKSLLSASWCGDVSDHVSWWSLCRCVGDAGEHCVGVMLAVLWV